MAITKRLAKALARIDAHWDAVAALNDTLREAVVAWWQNNTQETADAVRVAGKALEDKMAEQQDRTTAHQQMTDMMASHLRNAIAASQAPQQHGA